MKKDYYLAKRRAILSLQFYRDRGGTPNFLITSNPQKNGEYAFTGVDKHIFAKNLIADSLVSREEVQFLCDFFRAVERELKSQQPAKEE